jgi:hypothetical protein
MLCDEWHRFRWHKLFGNAMPGEVISVLLHCARLQLLQDRVVALSDIEEALAAITKFTDELVEIGGRDALRLHLPDAEVEDIDLDFSAFPPLVEKHLRFLFGEDLRSVLGIHLLLQEVMPFKCKRSMPALSRSDIHKIAWQCHQVVLAQRERKLAAAAK